MLLITLTPLGWDAVSLFLCRSCFVEDIFRERRARFLRALGKEKAATTGAPTS